MTHVESSERTLSTFVTSSGRLCELRVSKIASALDECIIEVPSSNVLPHLHTFGFQICKDAGREPVYDIGFPYPGAATRDSAVSLVSCC